MRIAEFFPGIQGEGLYQNECMTFVRAAGCNLLPGCSWCDTTYAQDPNKGKELSVQEVVKEISKLSPHYKSWVCITGGEPLWQEQELYELVKELKKGSYRITIETNGSIKPPRWYTLVDSWSADIKTPSSRVCGVSSETWFNTRIFDQIKFVVMDSKDLEFTKEVLSRHRTDSPVVLISPVWNGIESKKGLLISQDWLREVWQFVIEHRLRLSIQQHKVVWGSKKGV